MNMETVIAPSPLKMTDFMVEAILDPTSSDKFDVARKIASLATLLIDKEIDPRDAAISSDNALFQKAKEYQVGAGKISEEDAIDEVSDRKAVVLVSIIEKVAVKTFGAIGGALGALISHGKPKIVELGKCTGEALGRRMARNPSVHKAIKIGSRKIVSKVRAVYKCAVRKVGEFGKSLLKNAVALV
jgi:hypothetical protein